MKQLLGPRPIRWLWLVLGGLLLGAITRTADDYFEISKNMEILGKIYLEVNQTYVDETNPTELMHTSIDAMLASLDPYTNYYSESQIEYAKLMNSGQYSGIGAEIGLRRDRMVVLELYGGGPADEAGLRVGDELIMVDQISLIDEQLTLDEVNSLLLGEKGSPLSVTVNRSGQAESLEIAISRGGTDTERENVPYYGMINDSIGYILLKGFTGEAAAEMRAATASLRKDHPALASLVLDLRGNPGGRLDQAVDICNLFISQGEQIVEMRGRTPDSKNIFYTRQPAWDLDIPLAVIVNGRSASASEIVSGAIQDLDRGVIVGRRSFGKGLVQNVRPLSYNTQMKITIAKYYTPSGRCIQAIDYAHRNPDGSVGRIPDSLNTAFDTRNGREVYDGGGIDPDLEVVKPDPSPVIIALEQQNLIFDFASQYASERDSLPPPRSFDIDDATYRQFVAFVESKQFDFRTATEQQLETVTEALQSAGYAPAIMEALEGLRSRLREQKDQDLYRFQAEISDRLRDEVIQRFYFQQGVIEASFDHDPDLVTAIEVLTDPARYREILRLPSE
jgi:carboxyl-terminal processing protease